MLTTETYELGAEFEKLNDRIDELDESLKELEEGTDEYTATESRRDRLRYFRNGLEWQRDEEEWGADTEIELGAMTAGERAMMYREIPEVADEDERTLWFTAASTANAPYGGSDEELKETFSSLANCHPAFADWLEAKTNSLSVAGGPGNRSSTSSTETMTEASETSTGKRNSTTTSSSDSPTA
ncbi:hypothetical protein [Natrinema halophilum]|uniref:hypothetical protein n=1 Tax=Natrinema halophilum TaxID=1699371 RepID=UPI001F31C740|nr:hypothetical protein [Natrinema halophilum]UHQ96464.1 hypothetical protein HYG82_23365 [Natrinema halophilum]